MKADCDPHESVDGASWCRLLQEGARPPRSAAAIEIPGCQLCQHRQSVRAGHRHDEMKRRPELPVRELERKLKPSGMTRRLVCLGVEQDRLPDHLPGHRRNAGARCRNSGSRPRPRRRPHRPAETAGQAAAAHPAIETPVARPPSLQGGRRRDCHSSVSLSVGRRRRYWTRSWLVLSARADRRPGHCRSWGLLRDPGPLTPVSWQPARPVDPNRQTAAA